MAQLTIYLDDETLKRIEKSARQEKGSVSAWVKRRLTVSLEEGWPAGYFDLFGSLKEADLKRPAQLPSSADRRRAEL
ncbi:MAG: toxin-antitoxin system, antitoxin component [Candidatus Omnitrophica bacterium]|nr:toxin-antitoxin system, antitoxin component [Candidatus Omnitrophota bacterium]